MRGGEGANPPDCELIGKSHAYEAFSTGRCSVSVKCSKCGDVVELGYTTRITEEWREKAQLVMEAYRRLGRHLKIP